MKQVKIIYGSETYLMHREEQSFLEAFRKRAGEEPELSVFSKDAAPAQVVEAFQSSSLFGGTNVCIWHDCPYLPIKRGGRSRSKLTKEETWFLEQLAAIPEGNGLLFVIKFPKETSRLDTGCVFFKEVKKLAEVAECQPVTDKTVMTYVSSYMNGRGLHLSPSADRYLRGLFQTWDAIPLQYVFSELDKLCIMLPDGTREIETTHLTSLFSGTMEKNLFTFMDYFLRRDGRHTIPFISSLFSRQDAFLKNTGYMLSRLRLLRAYKELQAAGMKEKQSEQVLTRVSKGKPVKYALYHLKKIASYWKIEELDELLLQIFTLQLNIRRGTAQSMDMEQLICLYCSNKGRV